SRLPDRCRRIFEMRRILGLSQREIARQLGVSENVVENEAARGLKAILAALAAEEAPAMTRRKA
ncbi:RNA polymerase sigma-24 factor, partial [Streptomyces coelicoflavus ZG0656]